MPTLLYSLGNVLSWNWEGIPLIHGCSLGRILCLVPQLGPQPCHSNCVENRVSEIQDRYRVSLSHWMHSVLHLIQPGPLVWKDRMYSTVLNNCRKLPGAHAS